MSYYQAIKSTIHTACMTGIDPVGALALICAAVSIPLTAPFFKLKRTFRLAVDSKCTRLVYTYLILIPVHSARRIGGQRRQYTWSSSVTWHHPGGSPFTPQSRLLKPSVGSLRSLWNQSQTVVKGMGPVATTSRTLILWNPATRWRRWSSWQLIPLFVAYFTCMYCLWLNATYLYLSDTYYFFSLFSTFGWLSDDLMWGKGPSLFKWKKVAPKWHLSVLFQTFFTFFT